MAEKVDKRRRPKGPTPTEKKKAILKKKAAEFDKKHGIKPGRDAKGRFGPGNPYGGFQETAGRPELYHEKWLESELNAMAEWVQDPQNIYLNKFCAQRGYLFKRLQEAVKRHPRFTETLEMIQQMLHSTWIEGASFKRMSESMAKLFLTQWKVIDPVETTLVVKNNNPLAQAVLESMDTSRDIVHDPERSSKRVSDESSLEDRESLQDN